MQKLPDTGCPEYQQLTRRGAISSLSAMAAGWLPQVQYSDDLEIDSSPVAGVQPRTATVRDVIVTVFLRGGADGLILCPPWKDSAYASYRRGTRVLAPTSTDAFKKAVDLDGFFRFSAGDGSPH